MSLVFGAQMLAYNQEEYIGYSLRALAPEVDIVVVAYAVEPFSAYNPSARSTFKRVDGTRKILDEVSKQHANVIVCEGRWDTEEQMRNDALGVLRTKGADVCFIVDADEFFPEGSIAEIRTRIMSLGRPGTVFWARFRNCYRRLDYAIDSPKLWLPVAAHLASDTCFERLRIPNGEIQRLSRDLFYWHLGYVLSDERMWEKVNTFSHAHEISQNWFKDKWLAWTPETRDLCRRDPARWPRADKIDPMNLPKCLHTHPYFRALQNVQG